MMKKHFTRSMLTGKPIVKIGYCGAYNLLRGLQPVGYMSGVYGWNCDVYDGGSVWILTGYRFYGVRGYYAYDYALETCEANARRVWEAGYAAGEDVTEYIAFFRGVFIRTMTALIEAGIA